MRTHAMPARSTLRAVVTTVVVTGALMVVLGLAGTVGYLLGSPGYGPLIFAEVPLALGLAAWLTATRGWRRYGFGRPALATSTAVLGLVLAALICAVPAATASGVGAAGGRLAGLVVLGILVGFVEEMIFRGILPRQFPASRPILAATVSTLAFALAHVVTAIAPGQSSTALARTVVFALAFGVFALLLVAATDSLWPAIVLHGVFDALGLTLIPRDAAVSDGIAMAVAAAAAIAMGVAVLVRRRRRAS